MDRRGYQLTCQFGDGVCLAVLCSMAFSMVVLLSATSAVGDDPNASVTPAKSPLLDTIFLKAGGELKGNIERELEGENGRKYLIFKTESGGLLKLDQARLIKRIKRADVIDREYQRRISIAGDDPNLIWQVYEWCREQDSGTVRFKNELRYLLQRIVELDANDDRARRLLGYDLVDGQWVLKNQLFANHGYVKNGTSWASDLQESVSEQVESRNYQEGLRKRALTQWLRDAKKPGANLSALAQPLYDFCDEIGLPIILHKEAKNEKNRRLRLLYVEAFGKVASFQANQALCFFAIQDTDIEVRERALTLLGQDHYNHATSVRLISPAFGANANEYVKRAAFAIGELGSPAGILPLVEALETVHVTAIAGNEPGRMKMNFGNGGGGMQVGGGPQSKKATYRNDEAVMALKKLTDQDFGYNEEAWKNWYLENYTLHDIDVRADE